MADGPRWIPLKSSEFAAELVYMQSRDAPWSLHQGRPREHVVEHVWRVNGFPALRRVVYYQHSRPRQVATRRHWESAWWAREKSDMVDERVRFVDLI